MLLLNLSFSIFKIKLFFFCYFKEKKKAEFFFARYNVQIFLSNITGDLLDVISKQLKDLI